MTIDQQKFTEVYNNFGISNGMPSVYSLNELEGTVPDIVSNSVSPTALNSGDLTVEINYVNGYLQSRNFVTGTTGWQIKADGTAEFVGLTLSGGTLNYGKTSFADSINAGYFLSPLGWYVGSAGDVTKIQYILATGVFDFIGTISSRSTVTIAGAINSSGNLVNDIVNARLNSSAQTILAGFDFGTTDYAGAVRTGTITWNTATGAITGGDGVAIYRGGIIGAKAGVPTFSITISGDATFAGTLSAAHGSLGDITVGTNAWHVDSSGNMWWGNYATYALAFAANAVTISAAGSVYFTTGTFSGALGSGISITSPTITGGTLQTAASPAARIVIDNTNQIQAYDSSNKLRLKLDNTSLNFYDTAGTLKATLAGTAVAGDGVNITVGDLLIANNISIAIGNWLKWGGNNVLSMSADTSKIQCAVDLTSSNSGNLDLGQSNAIWRDVYARTFRVYGAAGSSSDYGILSYTASTDYNTFDKNLSVTGTFACNSINFNGTTRTSWPTAGISALSELSIDTAKSWGGNGISGLGTITPNSDSTYNLGAIGNEWAIGHIDKISSRSGGNVIDLGAEAANILTNKNFIPSSDNAVTSGSSGQRWSDVRTVLINGASSLRFKNVIKDLDEYDFLNNMPRVVEFTWKEENDSNRGKKYYGFSADDLPDEVSDKTDGSVNVLGAIAYAFGAIKELNKKVEKLKV